MRTQDEKIKGFNLLELIVVVVIIGVISAVGYPNFSKWRKDREARDAVIKIKTLIAFMIQLIRSFESKPPTDLITTEKGPIIWWNVQKIKMVIKDRLIVSKNSAACVSTVK